MYSWGESPGRAKAAESGLVEGSAQVGDEILGGLDADRQPDERGIDLERRPGDGEVGHDRRQLDERFDATERFGEGKQPGRLADRDGPLGRVTPATAAGPRNERDHPPSP